MHRTLLLAAALSVACVSVPERKAPPAWTSGAAIYVAGIDPSVFSGGQGGADQFRRNVIADLEAERFHILPAADPGELALALDNGVYGASAEVTVDGGVVEKLSVSSLVNDLRYSRTIEVRARELVNQLVESARVQAAATAPKGRRLAAIGGEAKGAAAPAPAAQALQSPQPEPQQAQPRPPAAAPQGRRIALAVLEFENEIQGNEIDRVYFSDQVRGAARDEVPSAQVMTRENTQQLLKTYGKRLEDCSGECEVETGKLLSADYVISGRITRVGTRYKLTLRMHDTANGTLLSAKTASGKTVDELDDELLKVVAQLLATLR